MDKLFNKKDWPVVRFGEVVRHINETEREPLKKGLERFVGLDCLDPENLHIGRWGLITEGTSFTKRFRKGQVLFGKRRAYQRKVAVAEWDGICSGDILTFEPENDRLLPELLPFIVQSDSFFEHALGTSAGSLSPRTKWTLLKEYEFPLPPKEEQKKLAEILWAAEKTIKKYSEVFIGILDCEKYFFNNYLRNHSLVSHDSTFIKTVYGKLPGYCTIKPLGDVADVAYGISKAVSSNSDPSIGWPILTGSNITLDGKLDIKKLVYIEPPTKDAFILRKGDLLFNWRSGSSHHVGKTAIFDLDGDWTYASFILRIRPKRELNKLYLYYLMNYMRGNKLLGATTSQQVNFKMNATVLRELPIIVPPISLQKKIVFGLSKMNQQREIVQKAIDQIRVIKSKNFDSLWSNVSSVQETR